MKPKMMNGSNYFNDEDFQTMCKELEAGNVIEVYIDCIGHTRSINEQYAYREAFEEKYGSKVAITGTASDAFYYELKKEEVQ